MDGWRPGRLVVVEGVDGAGKSSVIDALRTSLRPAVLVTRQPTDRYREHPAFRSYVTSDERERTVADAEALMHLAAQDRLRHTMEEILPALLSGRDVLCDRFTLSSLAYFSARGIEDVGAVEAANRFAPTPDLLIYLDLEPEVALVRVVNRDGRSEKLEEQDLQVMRKVRAAYRSWFPVVPARNRVLIDAAGSRDEVTRAAVDSLRFCSPLA